MEDTDKAVDIWGNTKDQQKQKSLDTDLLKKHVHSTVKKKTGNETTTTNKFLIHLNKWLTKLVVLSSTMTAVVVERFM